MTTAISPAQNRLPLERRVRVRLEDGTLAAPVSIGDCSDVRAWVLIGDPGAGKSDVFRERSQAEQGTYVSARDFVELAPPPNANSLIFIDGLDEISAGTAMGFTALGQIRAKLQQLGTPRFRIACREADWRGSADRQALEYLVGKDNFQELHLDSLSREESASLVAYWRPNAKETPVEFIRKAEAHDLGGLLGNPQTLRMLVEATASGWPASKKQVYEMACIELIKETNDVRLASAHASLRPAGELLHAAGYLCAVMLLSSKTSIEWAKPQALPTSSFDVTELPPHQTAPALAACRAALETRLFRGAGGSFEPVHRTVAEYLGARHLVQRLHAGLPSSRVLALMLGEDGGTVPELRGLHAWLAVVATGNLRTELVDHDPLGIVLYGDVQGFTHLEKLHLLDALSLEAKRYEHFRSGNWASQPFGALATADMEEDFRRLLASPDRSPHHLALVDCILDALAHGHDMPGLKPELERLIRDASYWPSSRSEALRLLIAQEKATNCWPASRQLLQDIHARKTEDAEDELLGTLLAALYPGQIPTTEIWTYFKKPKSDALIGAYWHFWHTLVEEKAPDQDIPALLDALIAQGFQLSNQYDHLNSANIIGALLVNGIRQYGATIDTPRLYRWLSLGLGPHHHCPLDRQHQEALRQWLAEHPDHYKTLFEHGLHLQAGPQNPGYGLWPVLQHLYRAPEPRDAGPWYLSLAKQTTQDEWRRHLLGMAFRFTEEKNGINSALEMLAAWRISHPADAPWVNGFLQCPYPPNAQDQEYINSEIEYRQRVNEEEREKIEFFRQTLPSFNSDSAHLGALVEVANAYLDFFHHDNKATPEKRLLDLLNQNPDWAQLALHGLRQCLLRKDLPSAQEIIDLDAQGRRYNVATPCLAAMALRHAEEPATALALSDAQLEMLAAFRLTNDYNEPPAWFKQLLATRPEILACVLQPLIRAQIAAKKEHVVGLYALAHDPEYATVAKQIVPDLLNEFPTKAHKKQLQSLRLLVVSALAQLQPSTTLNIIAGKLAGKPTDVAQQVYWLSAGLQLAPDLYLETARRCIGQTQARSSHLVSLLLEQRKENGRRITWPIAVLAFLIQLLGPRCNPRVWRGGAHWVSPAMELAEYVEGLISTLAGMPDEASTQALSALLQEHKLAHWSDVLRRAIFDQQLTRRKARFQPASVAQVCATLANLTPANAADLWALTLDHLKQLRREIRHGNTNDYRQYWAGTEPKLEEDCRDTLLSDLKQRLTPLDVSAEPEGRYADEKRADIRVSAQGYNTPIEIKRESHADLWKAITEQLIAKYTRDPGCDGFGIYLVFWFGGTKQPPPFDGGTRPQTPQELEDRLTRTVPDGHRHKIAVLVMDCSPKPLRSI